MRRLLRTLLPIAVLAACGLCVPAAGAATGLAPAREFAPRQLLVKFEGQQRGRALALALAPGVGVRRSARALRQNPRVVYAEPNYIVRASAAPDDPSFGEQWAL
ncbi:MAG TPA: hypothetical protein VK480_00875, partial [Solirubrobacterales bacterium]|nr:hypothetical protein [Solirubrobacterales bacterium]